MFHQFATGCAESVPNTWTGRHLDRVSVGPSRIIQFEGYT